MTPKTILIILLLALLLIAPASATLEVTGGNIDIAQVIAPGYPSVFSYTCDPDEAISIIQFDLPINSVTNFTAYYGVDQSVTGWMIYRPAGAFGVSYSEVSIGDDVYSETFPDAQVLGYALTKNVEFVSYARNVTGTNIDVGFAVYAQGYGLFSNEIAFYEVENLPANLITGISFVSDSDIGTIVTTNKYDRLATFVSETTYDHTSEALLEPVQMWLDFAVGIGSALYDFVTALFYWIKFLFIDNLLTTVALYMAITMAFAARSARGSPARFLRSWISDQRKFFLFMIALWNLLLDLISKFRGIFRI